MGASFRIGVDLGGTKIEAAALDGAGNIRLRRRMATPTGDYDRTVAAVAGLVDEIERELGERATVGVFNRELTALYAAFCKGPLSKRPAWSKMPTRPG